MIRNVFFFTSHLVVSKITFYLKPSDSQCLVDEEESRHDIIKKVPLSFDWSLSRFIVNKLRGLKMVADVDRWIDLARECKYLPENEMKVSNVSCHGILGLHVSSFFLLLQSHLLFVIVVLSYINSSICIFNLAFYIDDTKFLISSDFICRNYVNWCVICCLKNQMFIMFQPLSLYVETFMARWKKKNFTDNQFNSILNLNVVIPVLWLGGAL